MGRKEENDMRIRPQIMVAMVLVSVIAVASILVGWRMDAVEVITGAG